MLNDFISLFFPNYCLACNNNLVKGEKLICLKCDYELPKTNSHLIHQNFIATKFYGRVHLSRALALYKFYKQGGVQRLLHRLKYSNRPELGVLMGEKYGRELAEAGLDENLDLIVPVPLHRSKLKRRGYNQSAKFGEGLSISLEIPMESHVLVRNVRTSTQTRKSRMERWQNVDAIFSINGSIDISSKRILLVDDVITTGATLESCAHSLLKAGCADVSVCAIAAAQ